MEHTIETHSGSVRLDRDPEADVPPLPWWPHASVTPSRSEDAPYPWSLDLEDAPQALALRFHSGIYPKRESALGVLRFQRMIAPAAIAEFLGYGFAGTLLPASFLEEMNDGRFRAGQLLFGSSPRIQPGAEGATQDDAYEEAFGPGATNLFLSFAQATIEAWSASGLPPRKLGDLEIVTGGQARDVFVDFLVREGRTYYVGPEVRADDPIWAPAAQAGLRKIRLLP